MKFSLLKLAVIVFMFIEVQSTYSQEAEASPIMPGVTSSAIYFGPIVGFNRSLHSVDLASFADDPLCPFFTNGSANGFFVGFFYEQFFGEKKNSKHSLKIALMYNTLPASLTTEGDEYPSLVKKPDGTYTTINSATSHSVNVKYDLATLELMYKFNVVGGLVVTVGPTFDLPLTKTFTQKYQIIKPDNVQFQRDPEADKKGYRYEDNDRTIVVKDGNIPDAAGFRFAIKAGVQYEVELEGLKLAVIPGVFYNFGITKLTSAEDWKVDALQFGIDFRYALGL